MGVDDLVSDYGSSQKWRRFRKYRWKGKIHGYLAFDGDMSIGWCNAADMESYVGFVPDFARQTACGKTI